MKLIYIGEKYYSESSTMMSSLYIEDTWQRYDWGFVSCALRDGDKLEIRPATLNELKIADKMLLDIKKGRILK